MTKRFLKVQNIAVVLYEVAGIWFLPKEMRFMWFDLILDCYLYEECLQRSRLYHLCHKQDHSF